MSKYELDDHDVNVILQQLRDRGSGMAREIADRLEAQIQLAIPTKVGAVVKTEHPTLGGYYLRWAHDNATHSPWVQVGNHEEPYRTDEIGRITEVLSEGVDL